MHLQMLQKWYAFTMKRQLLYILSVLSVVCALVWVPAYADEALPAGEEGAASGAAANVAGEGESEVAEVPMIPALTPFETIDRVAHSVLSINKDALFQRQFDWEAVETVNFDSANEDGSLSEWQVDWYISHDWSDYGAVIASLEPGDAVTVNGRTVLILGREEWPTGSINWDIYDAIGWDKVVFQTCLGDYAIWIAYGIPVHPTPEFLAEHQ